MDNKCLRADMQLIIQKVMLKENIKKYEWEIQGQTDIGENYTGDVTFFKVLTDGGNKIYSFVMKAAKKDEEIRSSFPLSTLYNRELLAYTEVFPSFRRYINEHNSSFSFDVAPKIYWTESHLNGELLILENMTAKGYKLWERKKPWNLEHSLVVMKKYGQLHGMSFALRQNRPETFEELKKKLTNVFVEFSKFSDVGKFYGELWKNVLVSLKDSENDDLLKKFEKFDEDITSVMEATAEESNELVICHGDCWSNNFLFKYQEENNTVPINACFLDFQLLVVDSPVKDLSSNIYSTCDKTCLDQFDLLMKTYYSSLSTTVESLGGNLERNFSYDDLMKHWKKYAKFGVILCTELLKAALLDKSDLEQVTENGLNVNKNFSSIQFSNDEEYKRRMVDILTHYSENFL